MPENDYELKGRLDRLEKEFDELYAAFKSLEKTIYSLNTTIAVLEQTIRNLKADSDSKADFSGKVMYSVIGVVVSAVVAFILKGGLTQ